MKLPKWFDEGARKKKKDSIKQEKRWAEELKGERRPASGALMGKRGDITKDKFLFELKRTENMSISITLDMWRKICKQSFPFKIPAMGLTIQNIDLVVIDKDTFQTLIERNKTT